jgi:hypothetical protein
MDFGYVKARGTSKTRKAWITNPFRAVFWQLILPYLEGFGDEVERSRNTELANLREKITGDIASLQAKITSDIAFLQAKITDELASLRQEIELRRHAELSAIHENITHAFESFKEEIERYHRVELNSFREASGRETASRVAGVRKDAMAMAHRLAGLEEEAFRAEQVLKTILERLGPSAEEAHEAATYVGAPHADVRPSARAPGETFDAASTTAQDAAG